MLQTGRIRDLSSGRTDLLIPELVDEQGNATRLQQATAAITGAVELATDAEAVAGADAARAVTPHALGASLAELYTISFTGHNLAGACTATGVAVGDLIFGIAGLMTVGQAKASFEATVSVINQIQQTAASDLSLENYLALVYRPA